MTQTNQPLRILFLASELEGIIKTGGLGDVARALPAALQAQGHQVMVVLPCYKEVKSLIGDGKSHTDASLQVGEFQYLFTICQLEPFGVPILAIDAPHYFERNELYGSAEKPYEDNGERFAFFALAALQAAQLYNFQPDIVHCNDWHSALAPFYLKTLLAENPFFSRSRSLLTLHNGAYQGIEALDKIRFANVLRPYLKTDMLQGENHLNFLKVGLLCADAFNAVSPTYAQELTTPLGGHKLDYLIRPRQQHLYGVLNGCDYDMWDPTTDPYLETHFSHKALEGKAQNKQYLQRQFELSEQANIPLIGMVTRLTEQKGFSILLPVLEDILKENVQMVIVGTGVQQTVSQLRHLAQQYPQKLAFLEGYNESLSHALQAGSDFFLMPSIFEPCGLTQMYSLAYGNLPIARAVGGLKDTIVDADLEPDVATGFIFKEAHPCALLATVKRALNVYTNAHEQYVQMQRRGMKLRFTWAKTAHNYINIYRNLLNS